MPNDLPDWTVQHWAQLLSVGAQFLGDTGAQTLSADLATSTITTTGGPIVAAIADVASFKAGAGNVFTKVGNLGASTLGSATSISPGFGQATTAGNLLVAWVSAFAAEPTTAQAGWVKIVSAVSGGLWAAIWVKLSAAGADAAPTFTAAGGLDFMRAQLGEFNPSVGTAALDQSSTAATIAGSTMSVQNPATDAAFGDLILVATRWAWTTVASTTFSETLNNGATVVRASAGGGFNTVQSSIFFYGIVPAASIQLPLGVRAWDYDVLGTSAPAAGGLASVVLAASTGKAYRLAHISAGLVQVTGALAAPLVQVKDGASVIWNRYLGISATAGDKDGFDLSGLAIKGTAGNSMTIVFSAAIAGAGESISVGAYLQ
jgi:hypothetical protein